MTKFEEKIIEIGRKLGVKNYTPGMSGNISLRADKGVYITASGTCLADLGKEDIVFIDFDANLIKGKKKPSSEKCLHIEIYKKRPDINAIIHCHSPKLSAFSVANIPLDKHILAENTFYFGEIPLADYAMPSSQNLVDNTIKYFDKYNAVLLANHGFIVGAKDLNEAYYLTETAETTAQIYIDAKILGGVVELSEKDVKDVFELRKTRK